MSEKMTFDDVDAMLSHYGVKGMKWGVIRSRKSSGGSSKSESNSTSKKTVVSDKIQSVKLKTPKKPQKVKMETDVLEAKKPKKKSLSEMSDAELRSALNRLQMEKQYAELTRQPAKNSRLKKGLAVTGRVLGQSAEQVGRQYVTHQMNKALRNYDPTYKGGSEKKKSEKGA